MLFFFPIDALRAIQRSVGRCNGHDDLEADHRLGKHGDGADYKRPSCQVEKEGAEGAAIKGGEADRSCLRAGVC
jgi:hypothetical protein